MTDESHRTRLACALEQDSPELALTDLARGLKAEGMPVSEVVGLYHDFLLQHTDDADATKHDAIHKVLSSIRGVADVDSFLHRQRIPRKKPYFGIIALVAPFLGYVLGRVVAWLVFRHYGDGEMMGLALLAVFILTLFCFLILGGAASIFALRRGEKYTALGWVGLVLNFGPVLLFLLEYLTDR